MTPDSSQPRLNPRHAALLTLVALVAWVIHFSAPADQLDDDQLKPWGYVADIVLHGRWMVQTDYEGAFMSKPPLYQWLCALLANAGLGISSLAMYLPTGLAMLGSALLAWRLGTRWFGARIGLASGLAFLLSPLTIKHLCLARTDALFCLTVGLTAAAAWRIWNGGGARAWLLFWFVAALATLTKGPLGVVLGAGGLLAIPWCELRSADNRPPRERSDWLWCFIGATLWLAIVGGWFWLAVREGGQGVIDRMIGRELVGHAVHNDITGRGVFSGWYKPPLYFLSRYLPWGIITVIAMVRVVARPAHAALARRAERFLFCWIALGMLIFCASPHQRADLLLPLIPAAAILAGREVEGWLSGALAGPIPRDRRGFPGCFWPLAAIIMLAQAWLWHHRGRLADGEVEQTQAVIAASEKLRTLADAHPAPIEFADNAWDAQWLWNVKRPGLTPAQAAAALSGPRPIYLIVRDSEPIRAALAPLGAREVLREQTAAPATTFIVYTNMP